MCTFTGLGSGLFFLLFGESDCCLLEAFPPLPFLLPLEDERLELELPERDELLSELPLELLLDEEEDPDLLRERDELESDPDPLLEEFFLFLSRPRSDPLFFLSLLLLWLRTIFETYLTFM
mmetsp:Transcript_16537/g.28672  ORF Transcript_16537/g.28672 Transcript_16537/m.28672 type:complete len:121 (-) Transcript_16537:19-381(-)